MFFIFNIIKQLCLSQNGKASPFLWDNPLFCERFGKKVRMILPAERKTPFGNTRREFFIRGIAFSFGIVARRSN